MLRIHWAIHFWSTWLYVWLIYLYIFYFFIFFMFSRFLANLSRTSSTGYLTNMSQESQSQVIKKAKRVHPTENKRKFHLISLHYIKLDNPHSRLHLSSQHFLLPRLPGGDVHPPVWYPYLQSQHKRARRQLNIVLLKKAIFQASVEKRLKATVPKVVQSKIKWIQPSLLRCQ